MVGAVGRPAGQRRIATGPGPRTAGPTRDPSSSPVAARGRPPRPARSTSEVTTPVRPQEPRRHGRVSRQGHHARPALDPGAPGHLRRPARSRHVHDTRHHRTRHRRRRRVIETGTRPATHPHRMGRPAPARAAPALLRRGVRRPVPGHRLPDRAGLRVPPSCPTWSTPTSCSPAADRPGPLARRPGRRRRRGPPRGHPERRGRADRPGPHHRRRPRRRRPGPTTSSAPSTSTPTPRRSAAPSTPGGTPRRCRPLSTACTATCCSASPAGSTPSWPRAGCGCSPSAAWPCGSARSAAAQGDGRPAAAAGDAPRTAADPGLARRDRRLAHRRAALPQRHRPDLVDLRRRPVRHRGRRGEAVDAVAGRRAGAGAGRSADLASRTRWTAA